jgi:hypothetical protein
MHFHVGSDQPNEIQRVTARRKTTHPICRLHVDTNKVLLLHVQADTRAKAIQDCTLFSNRSLKQYVLDLWGRRPRPELNAHNFFFLGGGRGRSGELLACIRSRYVPSLSHSPGGICLRLQYSGGGGRRVGLGKGSLGFCLLRVSDSTLYVTGGGRQLSGAYCNVGGIRTETGISRSSELTGAL